ncbi:hypothetical protein BSR29_05205 [Boudabousia liubingyangii]|uniref:Gram-positive cocci surface proteins LPxTG domain-containing protein n=1 Tax=Boudabousia liubingyangii TaxID=1921764 RepID=A0A1Q5PLF8_9ACTO|nr:Ig-like domain-containing protein [Boudabousia liubingyangii]OKL47888.1 hypothetical protein BSR29_05205 [Boudabousia liubingyangii]
MATQFRKFAAATALAVVGVSASLLPAFTSTSVALAADGCVAPTGAEIKNAVTNVELDSDKLVAGHKVGYQIDFALPATPKAGDYFKYQLPAQYFEGVGVKNFPIVYKKDGSVYACAKQEKNGVTVVFNSAAEKLAEQITGSLEFNATVKAFESDQLVSVPIKLTEKNSITINISQPTGREEDPKYFTKEGWFTLPFDHQYFNIKRGLSWRIFSPTFDHEVKHVKLTDYADKGGLWEFNCGWNDANIEKMLTIEGKNYSEAQLKSLREGVKYSCTPNLLTVEMDVLPAGAQIKIAQVVAEIKGPLYNTTYYNIADFSGDGLKVKHVTSPLLYEKAGGVISDQEASNKTPEKPTPEAPKPPVKPTPEKPTPEAPKPPVKPTPEKPTPEAPKPPVKPTPEKTVEPTPEKTVKPTPEKTVEPTPEKTVEPTAEKTVEPTPEKTVETTPEAPTTPLVPNPAPPVIVQPTPEVTVESTPEKTLESTPEVSVEVPGVTVESPEAPVVSPKPGKPAEPVAPVGPKNSAQGGSVPTLPVTGGSNSGVSLAETGADAAVLGAAALVMAAAGSLIVVGAKRRKND